MIRTARHIALGALTGVLVSQSAALAASCTDGASRYDAVQRVSPAVVYAEQGDVAIIAVCTMDMAVKASATSGAEYEAIDFATGLNANRSDYDLGELASLMRSMGWSAAPKTFGSDSCVCAVQ